MTVLCMVGVVMMMRGRVHHQLRHLVVVNAQFLVVSYAGWRAQHRRRD